MPEYSYYNGQLIFKPGVVKDCYEKILQSKLVDNDRSVASLEDNTVHLNNIDKGYYFLDKIVNFEKVLKACLPHLAEICTLEHFLYSDGYYEITLDPQKTSLVKKKISGWDPRARRKYGEQICEEVANNLKKDKKAVQKIVSAYEQIILRLLNQGYFVDTDLGTFTLETEHRDKRQVRNPQTGEILNVKAQDYHRVVLKGRATR